MEGTRGERKPFWATVFATVVVFGWTLAIALFMGHEIDLRLLDEAQSIAQHLQSQNAQYVSKRELSLVAVQAYFNASTEVTEADFDRFTSSIMASMPGIRSISIIEPDLTIRWVSPRADNEQYRGVSLKDRESAPTARRALQTGKMTVSNVLPLISGEPGILMYLPIEEKGKPVALILTVNALKRYLDTLAMDTLSQEASLRLADGAGQVLFESGQMGRLKVNRALAIADQSWQLEVSPKASWFDYLPVILVGPVGLCIWVASLMFIWSDFFAARRLSEQVEARTAELARSLNELQTLDRMKNDFLSVVTHELRTPLTSIKGFSEFLEDDIGGELTETQREYVGHIQENSAQLEMLVDDLLDLARLESGKFTLRVQPSDGVVLAKQVVESLRPQAAEAGLTLETALPPGPEPLEADPYRVRQILNNLMSNAIKFTPRGGSVRLSLEGRPDALEYAVKDTGIGIALDHKERIFSKFFQVESQLNRSFKGTGLGLAITKGLVDAHHGHIELQSKLGEGTTVTVELPRRRSEDGA